MNYKGLAFLVSSAARPANAAFIGFYCLLFSTGATTFFSSSFAFAFGSFFSAGFSFFGCYSFLGFYSGTSCCSSSLLLTFCYIFAIFAAFCSSFFAFLRAYSIIHLDSSLFLTFFSSHEFLTLDLVLFFFIDRSHRFNLLRCAFLLHFSM